MVTRKLAAMATALSLCALTSPTLHAGTALPKAEAMTVTPGKHSPFSTLASLFDDVADERAEHSSQAYPSPAGEVFAGPYNLLVTEGADQNSLGMILASMGLMALIAHRRRTLP